MIWLLIIPNVTLILVAAAQWWHRRKMTDAELFPELNDGSDQP